MSVAGLHHSDGLQHGNDSEQVVPVAAQVGGGSLICATHVPLVLPGRTSQITASPFAFVGQQSAVVVQLWPSGWHAVGVCVLHTPLSQSAEQHAAFDEHVPPSGTQPPHTTPS
jgi:hypothetical protein